MIVHFLCSCRHWAWISTLLWCLAPIYGCFNVHLVPQEHHLQPVQASNSRPIQAQLSTSSLKEAQFLLSSTLCFWSKALKVWETKLVNVNQNIVFKLIMVCSLGSLYFIYISYWFFFLFEIISMWDVEKLEGEKGKKWMLTFC